MIPIAPSGFVLHPLNGKIPTLRDWQKLQETPIEAFENHNGNVGAVCGKASGFTAADLDHFLFLGEIFKGHDDLQTLRSKRTEGRGHIYFKYNPNLPASKHRDLGIEILSDGNNIVIPPSKHPSGDIYRWNDITIPIAEMPQGIEDNLKKLFKTEAELKQYIAKCRTCFRTILKDKKDLHGAEGREYMLAICTDLKKAGATEKHILMFARLIYREEFDEARTLNEWRNIDAAKTWSCAKLQEKVPALLDLGGCERCRIRREDYKTKENGNGSDNLIKYVENDNIELFHDEVGTPYARIPINEKKIIMQVGTKNKQFKQWLGHEIYKDGHGVIKSDTLSSAINVIEGKCLYEGKEHKLHNRVCWHEGAIWYDLGNWEAVKITPEKWEIIKDPPILFKRYSHQQPHDVSKIVPGGDVKKIFNYLNVSTEEEKDLLLTDIESYFIPDIPHPVILPYGEQGSTKSTMFSVIKSLVDPSIVLLATFPKDDAELMQQLDHNYFIGFDNVSGLSQWQSDVMCRAATGMGFSKRVLFSDEDDLIFKIKRCIGLNGINIVATKPDLLDRGVSIECQRVPEDKRKPESQFWKEFEQDKGAILGAIFDVISKAMRYKIEVSKLPRMADFALWGSALSYASGYETGHFINAYFKNIQRQDVAALESNVVGELLTGFMENRQDWSGTASELYFELHFLAENADMTRQFPNSPHSLTRNINQLKTTLTKTGLNYERKVNNKNTKIFLTKKTVANVETEPKDLGSGAISGAISCKITIAPPKHHLLNDSTLVDSGASGASGGISYTSLSLSLGEKEVKESVEVEKREGNTEMLQYTKNSTTTTTTTTPATVDILKSGGILTKTTEKENFKDKDGQDIRAFFDAYSRLTNPETSDEMKFRSQVAISQLQSKRGMPQEQAVLVWKDYCIKRSWPIENIQEVLQ